MVMWLRVNGPTPRSALRTDKRLVGSADTWRPSIRRDPADLDPDRDALDWPRAADGADAAAAKQRSE
jgi:hypothetical protein